jgi:hypothetical protein
VVNGWQLAADIDTVSPGLYRIRLAVSGVADRMLTDSVTFHLHQTFAVPVQVVEPQDGVASLQMIAWGAFTVGAVVTQDATRLELDLATVPEAPKAFTAA